LKVVNLSVHARSHCEGHLESEIQTNTKHMDADNLKKRISPEVATLRVRAVAIVNTRGSPGLQVGYNSTDYIFLVTGFPRL
jgi:hypothetical protein